MGIKLRSNEDSRVAVIACCDTCEQEITDADNALYTWEEMPLRVVSYAEPYMVHKGACDEQFKRVHQWAEHAPWMEMRVFAIYLAHNMNIDIEKAMRSAAFMSGIGMES
jgi:hypothetical protein